MPITMRAELHTGCATRSGCSLCSLDCLQQGCQARVVNITGDSEFRRRLLEMGFCNATCVELIRRAPFGDPIEFRLRGYCLSLRKEQAQNVTVAPLPHPS